MPPTEWNNLSSGLIGAIIGSVLGFVGSVFLNWQNQRTERKAAARAVLAEMFMNANRVLDAESNLHSSRLRRFRLARATAIDSTFNKMAELEDFGRYVR